MTTYAAPPPPGTTLVGKYLLPAERVVVIRRRHYAALWMPLAAFFGGLVLAVFLDIALPSSAAAARDLIWLAWSATCFYLAWELVEWWYDRFVVTNKRLMLVQGMVIRQVDMMPMGKVTDMRYERSLVGRLLGYGVFILESAGQDQALSRVDFVSHPDWLYREICSLVFTPDAPDPVALEHPDEPGVRAAVPRYGWAGFGPDDPDPDAGEH